MADKENKDKKPEPESKPETPPKANAENAQKQKKAENAAGETKKENQTDGQAATGAPVEAKAVRVKAARNVPVGIVHINATFNNTQVTITDLKGNVLAWSSSGRMGFKGARKSTAYASTVVAQETVRLVSPYRMQEVEVRVQGPGSGRESAIRALQAAGLSITVIKDITPMPHNGCRPRKRRRV